MRFDAARAISSIAELTTLASRQGGPGSGLSGFLTASLEASGWEVDDREVLGPATATVLWHGLVYLGVGVGSTAAVFLARLGAPADWRLMAWTLTFFWYLVAANHRPRRPWMIGPLKPARLILARRRSDTPPSARIVVEAPMGPIEGRAVGPASPWLDRGIAVVMMVLAISTTFDPPVSLAGPWISPGSLTWACLAGLWGAIFIGVGSRLIRARTGSGHPDAASLAFLLELARTWPESYSERVETILALVGGQELDRAGDVALTEIEKAEWPPRPTLTIIVAAPGRGEELLVVGSEVVREAADGLWVPNRHGAFAEVPESLRPTAPRDGESAVLAGAEWSRWPPPEIDPQALGRAAQVIREAALRWGRQHEGRDTQAPDDRSDARSSQNPG